MSHRLTNNYCVITNTFSRSVVLCIVNIYVAIEVVIINIQWIVHDYWYY